MKRRAHPVVVDGRPRARVLAPTAVDPVQPHGPHQAGHPLAPAADAPTEPELGEVRDRLLMQPRQLHGATTELRG